MKLDENLKDIELFLFDMDGTVYIGESEIGGAFDTVRRLKDDGKRICFFTNNSSKSAEDYIVKLARMGLEISRGEICTSGEVTCEYVNRIYPDKSVFVMGNAKLKKEFERHKITVTENNPDICVLGFDTELDYDKLYRFCKELYKGKPYIATHPDLYCPAEDCPMPDIGGMIMFIDATIARKPDIIIGKPYAEAADGIKRRFGLPADKIAMVGDRLYTDIEFGLKNGFKSVLVFSGETTPEMLEASPRKPHSVFNSVKDIYK